MKKFYLLIVSVFIIYTISSQTIIDTTKMWAVNTLDCFQIYGSTNYYKIGDTITISPYLYNQVFYATDSNYTNWTHDGYIRQEQEQYYYLATIGGSEKFLYDFDVLAGDTIPYYGMDFYVISVDTIFFAGQNRKRINISEDVNNPTWVESWYKGVGSDQGLLESFMKFIVGSDPELQCYWEDDVLLYHNTMFVDCWDYTAININKNSSSIIYPNPTTGRITIENSEYSIQNISVFDIYGRKVMKSEVGRPKTEVDLSQQPKGVYFVKLNTAEGVRVEKVIKN